MNNKTIIGNYVIIRRPDHLIVGDAMKYEMWNKATCAHDYFDDYLTAVQRAIMLQRQDAETIAEQKTRYRDL